MTYYKYRLASIQQEFTEKMEKEFHNSYVCPCCGKFLGNVPYDDLKKNKKCIYCGSLFSKE